MKSLEEIKQILNNNCELLSEKYKARVIGVFGSYVRGEQKKGSDVDILVEFNETVSLLKLVSLENFLTDFIGMKVDLIPKEDIRPELQKQILKEAIYIYQ